MFYMTLPSNSSIQHYPNNCASHFFTKLPQHVDLNGEYEVGLSEIQFSNTYFNVKEGEASFRYTLPQDNSEPPLFIDIVVPPGLYESNDAFVHTLTQMTKTWLGNLSNSKSRLRFYYKRASKRISLTVYESGAKLTLSPALQKIMAFPDSEITGTGHVEAQGMMELNQDFRGVFVYCDLVNPRPVGDVLVPLLRIVPTGDQKRDIVHRIFTKPHYIPLSRFQFNTVEILLTSDTGKEIPFINGHTVVTLHFRRKRPEYY